MSKLALPFYPLSFGFTSWLLVFATIAGCGRPYYRKQADEETTCLIAEKSLGTPWEAPYDYSVTPDPRSRFYDPSNPDFPCRS